jgi:chaperonin GroES
VATSKKKKAAQKGGMKPAKKATAKKTVAKKPAAKKTAVKKPAAKKPVAKKTAAQKPAAKKSAAKKTPTQKASLAKSAKAGKASAKKVARVAAPVGARRTTQFQTQSSKSKAAAPARAVEFKNFFSPLDDRVLVLPEGKSDRTAGGLFIPETVQDRPLRGKVVAVGHGRRGKKGDIKPLDVKLGDEVLYGPYTGVNLELRGQDVLILREEEILAVVNP